VAKLRDKLWLWAHPEGKYYNEYGNTEVSRMTPLEGAMYLDCSGLFMVPAGTIVNRRQYNLSFKPMQRVGWDLLRSHEGKSLEGAGVRPDFAKELVEEARQFDNITCGVFDDFIAGGRYKNFPLENIEKVADILHNNDVRRLDMWMVLYLDEFGVDEEKEKDFWPYIEPFDGIMLWTMGESNLWKFEERYKIYKEKTEGKKRILGLYLYNFGDSKKADPKEVAWQLDRYYELLRNKEVDGICLHTNTMADLDHEGYKVCLEWLAKHADDELPE
jgi:hypothetical protein